MHSTLVNIPIVFCLALSGSPSRAQQSFISSRPVNAKDRSCADLRTSTSVNWPGCAVRISSNRVPQVPFATKLFAAKAGRNDELPNTSNATSAFGIIRSSISVKVPHAQQDSSEGFERRITVDDVRSSAGTFGDPLRFVQMLPGVVSDNDQRNDFLVRGGNPSENLFVIDNIEIPSVNQLALSDTTGGFVSMIDNSAVKHMTLHTEAYDSKFDQRLSSVLEISTRPDGPQEVRSTAELGLAGVGGSTTLPWSRDGSIFLSTRHSVLHFITDDIGLNGVPKYQNELIRAGDRINEKDNWWGLSLTGIDSIKVHPSATDAWETNPFDIEYHGWRNTTGLNWQHLFSARSFGTASIANSQQSQRILQTDQLQFNAIVYNERTSDGITTLKYDWMAQTASWLTFTAGTRISVDRMNYVIEQPIGLQNPYSESPLPMDETSLNRSFATATTAEYTQAAILLPFKTEVVVGQRLAHWALGGYTALTPKILVATRVHERLVHAGYAEYAQAPPALYQLTFDNQRRLQPLHVQQITGGTDLTNNRFVQATLELYQKRYSAYPVALNYPELSMANIADTFGQAFLMFPMTGKGRGIARGIELSLEARPSSRLRFSSTLTYARSWYSGLDGVLRRGNFDLPLVANFGTVWSLGSGMRMTIRYSGASGRPYTPDNLPLSLAQNRDVYDVSKINSVRASSYHRLDLRFEKSQHFYHGTMTWHVGMQNVLGTNNFYSNQWRPRCPNCGALEQDQMPRFPDGGIEYHFGKE